MAKIRIKGDTSGYVDLDVPNAASSSTLDLDQVPQKNVANTFTTGQNITVPTNGGLTIQAGTNGSASLRLKNDATDWDVNCQTTDNFAIYNHTTGGNRLGITPAGIVTTPNQPAFFAHRNGGNYTETTATAKVYIDGTRFNHGGHYDTTNNRFVAPVDGVYQFNASVNCYYISSGYQLRAFLYVNGSNYVVGDSFHSANNSHDLVASVSHAINLSANDYVEVWSFSDDGSRGFSSSAVWNTFSGYLLG